jgi:hypothetical protein
MASTPIAFGEVREHAALLELAVVRSSCFDQTSRFDQRINADAFVATRPSQQLCSALLQTSHYSDTHIGAKYDLNSVDGVCLALDNICGIGNALNTRLHEIERNAEYKDILSEGKENDLSDVPRLRIDSPPRSPMTTRSQTPYSPQAPQLLSLYLGPGP